MAVTPGTTNRRCRAGAGERADSANQIPGVSVASLTLEQLMEAVGPVQYEEMRYPLPAATDQSATPYHPPLTQSATPYQSCQMQLSQLNNPL